MTKTSMRILAAMSLVIASSAASAQTTTSPAKPVTVETYSRAQTDVNFAGVVKAGGFGKFRHGRELAPPVQQGIVRPNRDTLYSFAIVDLDAGPVTITLPEAGKRFMGMQVVNEDQYTPLTYSGAGIHTLTRQMIGTRYAIVVVRFFVDFLLALCSASLKRVSGAYPFFRCPVRDALGRVTAVQKFLWYAGI
jgi:hypothetical protein